MNALLKKEIFVKGYYKYYPITHPWVFLIGFRFSTQVQAWVTHGYLWLGTSWAWQP